MNPIRHVQPHHRREWLRSAGFWLGLAAVYLALAIIATRPLISNAGSYTPWGSGSGDQCQVIWFFWWTKTALLNLHQSPFWTDFIYYPYGSGLGYHICPFTNLLAILVSGLSGIPINSPLLYNLMVLIAFPLTGLATFLLIRYVARNSLAGFVGSLIVTFAPYISFHLEHLNLILIGWGILAVYFTIRYLDTARIRDLAWAILFLTLQLYTSPTNAMLIGCFLILYLLLSARQIVSHVLRNRLVLQGVGGVILALILATPLLLSMRSAESRWPLTWRDSVPNSASLLDFVTPSHRPLQPALGETYIGWLIIAGAVAVLLYTRAKSRVKWAVLAGIFWLLSLGPTLLVGDRLVLDGWLPYRWLYSTVPYFSLSRTPSRFVILAQLCLSIVISLGISEIVSRIGQIANHNIRQLLLGGGGFLVSAALFLLYIRGPIALSPVYIPPVYQEVAADSTIKVICNLPIAEKLQICNWYMFWQTTHGRKEVNGYLTHHSITAPPLIDSIRAWQQFGPAEKAQLLAHGVDAVVIHHPQQESELIRLR